MTAVGSETRTLIEAMFAAALRAVDPSRVVADALRTLDVGDGSGKVIVVAIGKAGEAMARGAVAALGDRIDAGFVVTKDGHSTGVLDKRFQVFEAAHPVPDQRGVDATRTVVDAVRQLDRQDVVVALISGGGSALFEAPRPPLQLGEIAQVTKLLLRAGAPIQDLNAVRIPLSLIKGGGLRRAAGDSRMLTLLLSDVLGNDPHFIASGPTVLGENDPQRALALLRHYSVIDDVPRSVLDVLATLVDSDGSGFDRDVLRVVGDNASAVEAARAFADRQGRRVRVVWQAIEGEASTLGRAWVNEIAHADADVLIGGGEATVTVRGNGIGGRNTEFALAAAGELATLRIDDWTVASLATDGQDALTGAAGAMVDSLTISRAEMMGIDPRQALADNDSATLLERTGDLVITGPTGTNVNDLYFAVRQVD